MIMHSESNECIIIGIEILGKKPEEQKYQRLLELHCGIVVSDALLTQLFSEIADLHSEIE